MVREDIYIYIYIYIERERERERESEFSSLIMLYMCGLMFKVSERKSCSFLPFGYFEEIKSQTNPSKRLVL